MLSKFDGGGHVVPAVASPVARTLAILVAATVAIAHAPIAEAQDKWPSRRITLVVPFGAGSVTAATSRLLAEQLMDDLGQPVVVENRGGAGGTLASSAVAKAEPDGYTFLMGGNTTHSAAPALFKNLPYDPIKDFTPIARIGIYPSVMATNPQQSFKTVAAFVAFAKANPGKLSCGHGNSTGHITCETVKKRLGLDMPRVPYTSNPQALADLLGNSIQLMVPDFLNGLPQIQAGKIVPLAVVMRQRSPMLPDVPSFHETVMKDFEVAPWVSMFGPAGVPAPVVKRMSDSIGKIIAKPDIAKKMGEMGTAIAYLPSAPFAEFVKADIPVWAAHAKLAGIQPQ